MNLGLEELARDPKRTAELSAAERKRVLITCSAILAAIASCEEGREPPAPATGFQAMLTIEQAAERASVPVSRIRQAVKDKHLPSTKFGHYRRIHPDDLERLLTPRR